MTTETAWRADVPDAFLAVWRESAHRWRFRVRSTAGTVWRTAVRQSATAARSAASAEYKARVGRSAVQRVLWPACTPDEAREHGSDARDRLAARAVSSHVAECVRRSRDEAACRSARPPAPNTEGSPAPPSDVDPRPAPEFWHALELRFGRQPRDDPDYRAFIRSLPCLGCGRVGFSDPHHEPQRGASGGAWTDRQCVPFCRRPDRVGCHDVRNDLLPGWERLRDLALAAVGRLNAIYDLAPHGPRKGKRR